MNKQRAKNKAHAAMSYELRAKSKNSTLYTLRFALYAFCFIFAASVLLCSDAGAQTKQVRVPEVCYKCHAKLKEGLSQKFVHSPFKQGMCGSCHDMHASSNKGMVKDNINSLCLGCHEKTKALVSKENVHSAVKRGVCTDCHKPHSGEFKGLLVKSEKNLCWNCHDKLKEQLKRTVTHVPFKNGECSSCHDPHGSSNKNHLVAAPNSICKNCHAPRCSAGGVQITFATKDLDCTGCHTGHTSNTKGLLGPYGHTAFLNKTCEQCHNPFIAGQAINAKMSGEKLCFSCHQNDPAKFRANDVHKGSGKATCSLCHNYHASGRKNMTVDEYGVCIKCHESTEKRINLMTKAIKNIKCTPVKDRKCFECHIPLHSSQPYYFKADKIQTCARCHETQHKITHPLGAGIIDPRNGQPVTCISCHSLHTAKAEFMLTHDRKRQLCIQCHKR